MEKEEMRDGGLEMRGRWECLPGELLAYIFGKLEQDILAARGVCKHWRVSSLQLTSFTVRFYTPLYFQRTYQFITSMAAFISKAPFLEKLYVRDEANRFLELCDWTSLSHSLRTLEMDSQFGISERVWSLLSGCHSLSELTIRSQLSNTKMLSLQFVGRLRKLYIRGPVEADFFDNLPHLPCMEEVDLRLGYWRKRPDTVTLTAPKLRTLNVTFSGSRTLTVEAPLVTSMRVSGETLLYVSAACSELESVSLGPGTVLARGPNCLKRLGLELDEDRWISSSFMDSLGSCRAVPWITKLTITPLGFEEEGFRNEAIVERFVTEVGRLVKLEELEMNLHVVNLLEGVGPLTSFLPALKTMILDMHSPSVFYDGVYGAIADDIVETLRGFNFPTSSTKLKDAQDCDALVRTKVQQYLRDGV